MELNICHLYPDILNLYGDRGNILCMQKRLEWRGIGVTVTGVSIGQALEASAYDLLFVGGGQDFEQEVLLGDLAGAKTKDLKSAIEDGLPVLAICGGYQMLGQYYKTWDGAQCDFTGALDLYTIGSKDRMIGNYMFTCDELNCEIVGFENHSGKTYLGARCSRASATTARTEPRARGIKTCSARIHTVLCCRKIRSWPIISCASRSSANTAKRS